MECEHTSSRSNLLDTEHGEVDLSNESNGASCPGLGSSACSESPSPCSRAEPQLISTAWCSLKRSIPATVCLVMIGTAKVVCGFVGKWCFRLYRRTFRRPQTPQLVLPAKVNDFAGPAEEVPVEVSQANPELVEQDCQNTDNSQTPAIFEEQIGTKVAGFYLYDWQFPPGLGDRDLDALVRDVKEACSAIGPISQQQALRLVLGMGYNKDSAISKWRDVVAWRQAEEMHVLRSRLDELMGGEASVTFANDSDVYSKLFRGCPCALLTMDERPVSVWHAGATNVDKVTSLPMEDLKVWSREVFEYADLWVTKQTERTRRLTGYIQIYNMQGLSLRHTSKEVTERLKAALSAGGFYVEAVAHIYVINASRLFSMAWKLVRGFLSPWTASKITVSSEIPEELIAELGGPNSPSALHLHRLLLAASDASSPATLAPVLRPRMGSPRRSSEESVTGSTKSTATGSTRCSSTGQTGQISRLRTSCEQCEHSFEASAEAVLHQGMETSEPEGSIWIAGFLLRADQLPPGLEDRDLDALVEQVYSECCAIRPTTKQQALRLILGMGYSGPAAVAKWREIVEWRTAYGVDSIRQEQAEAIAADGPVSFPYREEVHEKLICTSPCAFLSTTGCPISIWHAGTLNVENASLLTNEKVAQWSRAVYEYKDVWITEQSEKSKRLVGYIQVYDMSGMNWRQYSSREIAEKLKAALQTGGFYVEAVSHMFVINSSTLFAAAWRVVRNLISPWTASKISVSRGIPDELIQLLGGPTSEAALKFQDLQRRTPREAVERTSILRPAWQVDPSASPRGMSVLTELSRESVSRADKDGPDPSEPSAAGIGIGRIRRIAGFLVAEDQLPPTEISIHQATLAVSEVQERCRPQDSAPTKQQALRLLIGMGYDPNAAVAKWNEITAWRASNRIDDVRREQASLMAGTSDIHFPNELEVYSKLIKVRPCVLRAADGSPVSIWHAGSLNTGSLSSLPSAAVSAWSHAVFEYKDLWVSQKSEEQKRLVGYIQVYDMQGMSLRHLSSRELMDKMKCALQVGSYYMEAVAHMYVINASVLFSMAWKVVRNLIPPRTASKITVSKDIPEELVQALGSQSAALKSLKEMCKEMREKSGDVSQHSGEVLRP